ncbi:DUF4279 domain-containing protein [Nostoc sp. CHAB 5844]|nr:DUF4279 domain-containing protein [Nostoc sp. CHAB 5844]
MSNSLNTTTCLLICAENLDTNLITEKLKLSPTAVTLKEQVILPSLVNGALRAYDSRLGLDCWKRSLTGKQYKFDIVKQLEFWIENLYPARSAFQEFKNLGYWSVIDCQISSTDSQLPSIQFRLTKEMQLKLSMICVDLDFTIYRPIA